MPTIKEHLRKARKRYIISLDYFRERIWLRFPFLRAIISRYPYIYFLINLPPRFLIALNAYSVKFIKGPNAVYNKEISRRIYDEFAGGDLENLKKNPDVLCLDHGSFMVMSVRELDEKSCFEVISIINSLNLPLGSRVLDFGCGEGLLLRHIAPMFKYNFVGFDYSYNRVRAAST